MNGSIAIAVAFVGSSAFVYVLQRLFPMRTPLDERIAKAEARAERAEARSRIFEDYAGDLRADIEARTPPPARDWPEELKKL